MTDFRSLKSNFDVLLTFGHLVQPFIGGKQSVKCVVADGEICYVRDVGALLQVLDIQHPTGQHLVRVCRAFIKQHHIGAATLLFFIRSFARVVDSLMSQGLEKRQVDKLLHVALEDCIQHATNLTMKLTMPDSEIEFRGSSLFSSSSVSNNTLKHSVKDCSYIQPLHNSQISFKAKLQKRKEEMKPGTNKTDEKHTTFQSSACIADNIEKVINWPNRSDSTRKIAVDIDIADVKNINVVISDQKQAGAKGGPLNPSEIKIKFEPKEKSRNQDTQDIEPSQDLLEIPVVELKMKNLQTESEDTDWFFETDSNADHKTSSGTYKKYCSQSSSDASQTDTTDYELKQANHNKAVIENQEDVDIQKLKHKWDAELLNDIRELKEGIETDLKIVRERRERMNRKLADFIQNRPESDADNEFDDCFLGLPDEVRFQTSASVSVKQSELRTVAHSKEELHFNKCSELENKSKPPDSPELILGQTGSRPESFGQTEISENKHFCNKTIESRSKKTVTSELGDATGLNNETNRFDNSKSKCRGQCLNERKVQTEEKVTLGLLGSDKVDTKNQCLHYKMSLCLEQKEKNAEFKTSAKNSEQSKIKSLKQKTSICDEVNLEQKTSGKKTNVNNLSTLNSLLTNIGVSNEDKTRLTVHKLGKNSRHIGEADLDITEEARDKPLLTSSVSALVKPKVCSVAVTNSPEKLKILEASKRTEDKDSEYLHIKGGGDENNQYWFYKLIKGLCPHTDDGIVEAVHQIVMKPLRGKKQDSRAFSIKLDISLIHCHSEVDMLPKKPEVIDGVIVSTIAENMILLQQWRDKLCSLMLVNGDVQPNYHHKGYKKVANTSVVGGLTSLTDRVSQSEQWLTDVRAVLKKHSIKIVLARGLVCEEMKLLCQQDEIVVMEMVPYKILEIISEACQADMVTYITLTSEINICRAITILPWIPEWMDKESSSRYKVVLKLPKMFVQTVVFSELTNQIASLKEQEFWDCLYLVTSALKSGQVLPGCARTELSCMEFCWKRAESERQQYEENRPVNYQPVVFDELAGAFKEYFDTYSANMCIAGQSEKLLNFEFQGSLELRQGKEELLLTDQIKENTSGTQQSQVFVRKMTQVEQASWSQTDTNFNGLDERLVTKSDLLSNIDDILQIQSADCDHSYNYIDDYVTKLAAWRAALDTVFMILNIDSFIQTGFTDGNTDTKFCSAL